MKAYLRGRLGVQAAPPGHLRLSATTGAPCRMLQSNATLDVMDGHFYWQHPRSSTPGVPMAARRLVHREHAHGGSARCLAGGALLARRRCRASPTSSPRSTSPSPTTTPAEFVPIIAAYGCCRIGTASSFTIIDGSWGPPYWQDEEWRKPPVARPLRWARTRSSGPRWRPGALMFLRGDVQRGANAGGARHAQRLGLESLRTPHPRRGPSLLDARPDRTLAAGAPHRDL